MKIKTQPVALAVALNTLKATLRIETSETDQDALLTLAIRTASKLVEQAGATLITTVYQAFYDRFPDAIQLPLSYPMQTVDSIKYIDQDGDEQTLSASLYRSNLNSIPAQIEPAYGEAWPTTRYISSAITVEYTAGFGDASTDLDPAFAAAVEAIAVDIYEHPEAQIVGTIATPNRSLQMLIDLTRIPKSY